jgi:hypothetical protein
MLMDSMPSLHPRPALGDCLAVYLHALAEHSPGKIIAGGFPRAATSPRHSCCAPRTRAADARGARRVFGWLRPGRSYRYRLAGGDGASVAFWGGMATKDHVRGGQDADGTRLRELSVSVRLGDGSVTERPLRQVTSGQVASGAPWRTARSARGQVHYPGSYWSATTGGHVIYESRLELARLLLADFDPDVTAIAASLSTDLSRPLDAGSILEVTR